MLTRRTTTSVRNALSYLRMFSSSKSPVNYSSWNTLRNWHGKHQLTPELNQLLLKYNTAYTIRANQLEPEVTQLILENKLALTY